METQGVKVPFYFLFPEQSEKDPVVIQATNLHNAIEHFLAEYHCKDFQAFTQAEYWRKYG